MSIGIYLLLGFIPLLFAFKTFGRLVVWLNILYLVPLLLQSLPLTSPFTTTPMQWSEVLNIQWSFQLDGLAKLFLLLISGIGILIFGYSLSYYHDNLKKLRQLNVYLQLFTLSMILLVLADNMIVLFTAWELTAITSFLLIQFYYHDESARKAAFQGMFITVMGGLALLCGFIVLQQLFDSWSLQHILHINNLTHINENHLAAAFCLILLGCMTKSAQFPFYFWLPGAMKAPTPVSAFLHSATMVNAGIYLLARLHGLFAPTSYWYPIIATIGLSTMLIGGVLALFPRDLKAILAYTTLFALGSMFYLLAGNNFEIAEGLVLFLLVHAIYKALLFMTVGVIDQRYGTRDLTHITGVARQSLPLAIAIIVGTLSMAGLPPFFGFFAKELVYEAKLATDSVSWSMMIISFFASMLTAAVSFKILFTLLRKTSNPLVAKPSVMPWGYVIPMALAIITALADFIPFELEKYVLEPAAAAMMPTTIATFPMPVVWRDWPVAFSLSLMTVVGGFILYRFIIPQMTRLSTFNLFNIINPARLFEQCIAGVLQLSHWLTRHTQNQSLTRHMTISFISLILIIGLGLITSWRDLSILFTIPEYETLLLVSFLFIGSGISLVRTKTFIHSLISLSVFGIALTLFFVLQNAPDVAMAQLLIEILTVIIIAIALRHNHLSYGTGNTNKHHQLISWSVAIGVGGLVTLLLLMVLNQPFNEQLGAFFIDNSLPLAFGKNVVNVILVDFRALDTLGEGLVIVAAALGITSLLSLVKSEHH